MRSAFLIPKGGNLKRKILLILGCILLAISIMLALYPSVSSTVNKIANKNTIREYNNQVSAFSDTEKEKLLNDAKKYNENLKQITRIHDSFSPDAYIVDPIYEDTLNINSEGMIGSVDIEKIHVHLPIFHGTDESNLSKGAVHMSNTSFPIGGASTHSVISAHTAYPGKIFFDKLDKVEIGDTFSVTVLDDKRTYKVIDIDIVEPDNTENLKIVEGKELCTLITCTPYSINTHRLLVTGEYTKEEEKIEEVKKDYSYIYIILGIIVLLILIILGRIIHAQKTKQNSKDPS